MLAQFTLLGMQSCTGKSGYILTALKFYKTENVVGKASMFYCGCGVLQQQTEKKCASCCCCKDGMGFTIYTCIIIRCHHSHFRILLDYTFIPKQLPISHHQPPYHIIQQLPTMARKSTSADVFKEHNTQPQFIFIT